MLARLSRIVEKSQHRFIFNISKVARYGRGRPKKEKQRIPKCFEYKIEAKIEQDPDKIQKLRTDAGCFLFIQHGNRPDYELNESSKPKYDFQRLIYFL